METQWAIVGVDAVDGLITQATYRVTGIQGDTTVETEGHWQIKDPKLGVPFADVTESMIVEWIKEQTMQDGQNMIEMRLSQQIKALQSAQQTNLPWMPQVFTPDV